MELLLCGRCVRTCVYLSVCHSRVWPTPSDLDSSVYFHIDSVLFRKPPFFQQPEKFTGLLKDWSRGHPWSLLHIPAKQPLQSNPEAADNFLIWHGLKLYKPVMNSCKRQSFKVLLESSHELFSCVVQGKLLKLTS